MATHLLLHRATLLARWLLPILLALLLVSPALGSGTGKRPNVILILADDLGYGDLSCYGSTKNRTPRLDKLAKQGVRFTSFYTIANVCTPTRASLMTGCYPQRVGLHQNEKGQLVLFPANRRGLAASEITLAELLRELGYVTGIIGKWHLGDQPPFLPTRHGFDFYFGIPFSNDMGRTNRPKGKETLFPPLPLLRNEKVIETEPDQALLTKRYTEEAVAFIERHKDRPFFLYLPHTMPHAPLFASANFKGKSANGILGDVVEELDWSVGVILDTLSKHRLDDNTLVLFLSDNGGPPRAGTSNGPLRGSKGTTWEGGHRVPFIARWPGRIPAGKVCEEMGVSFDLYTTIAKLAGGTRPKGRIVDGKDIWPLLAGKAEAKTPHEAVFFYSSARLEGVRSGKWKLYLPGRRPGGAKKGKEETRVQLFDLEQDLGEKNDVAERHPEVVKRLQGLAGRCREDLGDGERAGKNVRPADEVKEARPLARAEAPGGERGVSTPRFPPTSRGVDTPPLAGGKGKGGKRPNIVWITCEDMGPHLGAYGDRYATTPNLDRLAKRSLRYLNVWSNAPVCAPARTTIITGLYPTSTGSEHMRSMTRLPPNLSMYPALLRALGYYCTNRVKEDYNLEKDGKVWDDSSAKAHYKNRKPGQPFFAVFNFTITHESQIRKRPHKLVHDPAKVRIPVYHPDTPEVRHDWAQYYDNITEMDRMVGELLRELEESGLAEDTIIIFYSDHGSGMPRNKRWPGNSGLHVPLIAHFPERLRPLAPKEYAPGGQTNRLVSFVDLAPTLLSLAGERPPEWMQGQAFLGKHEGQPREYLHGFRGRMDERIDLMRSVRDQRYVYIRNYMPHKIDGQHLDYMFQTPTTRVWKKLFDAGKLTPEQSHFWKPREPEELYDLQTDPDEVRNLAGSPEHQEILKRFRKVQYEHALRVRDVGFLPEDEIHGRSAGSTPYEMGRDEKKCPLKRILETADLASMLRPEALPELRKALTDEDSAVRYWAAMGVLMRGKKAVEAARDDLRKALADKAPAVRIAAAEALGKHGNDQDLKQALPVLLELAPIKKNNRYVAVMALNALGELGPRAAAGLPAIRAAAQGADSVPMRYRSYVPRLVEKLVADLQQ
ncbi:MAG: sulfatase-like hydrolase/transferase [Gemmataceae bacterium]|nr:sulfatase-like hydrolase/transferase [Gemmataceae bacterium]